MKDIKTRKVNKSIKTLDKGVIATTRLKDSIVSLRNRTNKINSSEENSNEYASDKILFTEKRIKRKSLNKIDKSSKQIFKNAREKVKDIKNKNKIRQTEKIKKKIIKDNQKAIKSSEIVANTSRKISERMINTTKKAARESIKAGVKTTKKVVNITVNTIKAIIAGTKALVSALIALGTTSFIIILVVCLLGLLCSSIFGIFFASEDIDGTKQISNVVSELNQEMANRIKEIQESNTYDDYTIISNRASWKDVLAVYAIRISNGTNERDVITLDGEKETILKETFWSMNEITSFVSEQMVDEEYLENDELLIRTVNKNILTININSKTPSDMGIVYNFNTEQIQQLNELLSDEYSTLWTSVIFGTKIGNSNIVQIALSQVGNVGGEPYWSWYGFTSRVEWCAVFISWIADQAGYIESNVIPKFANCEAGVNWFKAVGEWQNSSYVPSVGDIIFFDWEQDGKVNHVGIVEKVENGIIYTVEGNSNDDMCREKQYEINSKYIYGYGTPAY